MHRNASQPLGLTLAGLEKRVDEDHLDTKLLDHLQGVSQVRIVGDHHGRAACAGIQGILQQIGSQVYIRAFFFRSSGFDQNEGPIGWLTVLGPFENPTRMVSFRRFQPGTKEMGEFRPWFSSLRCQRGQSA